MSRYIIRTSDRRTFKQCRQLWDFGSKIRMNYEPDKEPIYFKFGTAIHAGIEQINNPLTYQNRQVGLALGLQAFSESFTPYDNVEEYEEYLALGKAMIIGYEKEYRNDNFIPRYCELEFEVPILFPQGLEYLPSRFIKSTDNQLLFLDDDAQAFLPVVYQGRIDAIHEDEFGKYWIFDYKTASAFKTNLDWLALDEQMGSYAWAFQQMLGIQIEGVVYDELLKTAPHPPKVLKNGSLSQDRRQNTSLDLYLQSIRECGMVEAEYSEFLDFLRLQPNKFFRRTVVQRSQRELQILGDKICIEAIDMLNSPSIYSNPSGMCGTCSYFAPCLAKSDGSDYKWMLNENFHLRKSDA